MSKRYFGTDGIRGRVNSGAMTASTLCAIAGSAGRLILPEGKTGTVVIGSDTRQSADMIRAALTAGFTGSGLDVHYLGVVPTPATAMMTQALGANLGVMITASHNPYHDNGIKFFGPDGCKLSDETELAIEAGVTDEAPVQQEHVGQSFMRDGAKAHYVKSLIASTSSLAPLSGLNIVLDCANGAAFETGPEILRRLGPKSLTIVGDAPNGVNINLECGSTHTELLAKTVLETSADIGVALDGDADRLIMCDETGRIIDGDQLLGLMGAAGKANGTLKGGAVVATVMSNLGLERYLDGLGLSLERTAVGDRHVAERMRTGGYNIGGEQSGHLLMTDYCTTGDGMLAAIHVLMEIARRGQPASEVLSVFTPVPQHLTNVRYSGDSPMNNPDVLQAVEAANAEMAGQGRVLVRASGTEPLIRVMVEGDDAELVKSVTAKLADLIGSV